MEHIKKITNLIFNLQPLSVCFTLLLSNIKTNKIYIIITFSDDRLWRLFLADARTRGNGVATPFSKQETKCFLILLVSKSALRSGDTGVMVAHSNMKAAAYTPQYPSISLAILLHILCSLLWSNELRCQRQQGRYTLRTRLVHLCPGLEGYPVHVRYHVSANR